MIKVIKFDLIKIPIAKDLLKLIMDDCDLILDSMFGTLTQIECFDIKDPDLWDSYASFFGDICDLLDHHNVSEKVIGYVEEYMYTFQDFYLYSHKHETKEMNEVYEEKFWGDLYKCCSLINANLYGIEHRKLG